MKIHQLKTHPEAFEAVRTGRKKAEFRHDNRGFEAGDILCLEQFDPKPHSYGDDYVIAFITDIRRGPNFGIPERYAMLSMLPLDFQPKGKNVMGTTVESRKQLIRLFNAAPEAKQRAFLASFVMEANPL